MKRNVIDHFVGVVIGTAAGKTAYDTFNSAMAVSEESSIALIVASYGVGLFGAYVAFLLSSLGSMQLRTSDDPTPKP